MNADRSVIFASMTLIEKLQSKENSTIFKTIPSVYGDDREWTGESKRRI